MKPTLKRFRNPFVETFTLVALAWPGLSLAAASTHEDGPTFAEAHENASVGAESSPQFVGRELAKQAHVTLPDARSIALKARSGEITDQELEKERGGSGLRYSFDIKSAGVVYEVGVDAKTGKVLENAPEGKNPD